MLMKENLEPYLAERADNRHRNVASTKNIIAVR